MVIGLAAGASMVNLSCMDARQSEEQRYGQRRRGEENGLIREGVADGADQCGRRNASGRSKALIASQPFSKCVMTDEAEADGGDRRPQEPAGQTLQHQRGEHDRKGRPKRDDQGAERNDACAQRNEQTFGAGGVEQLAARKLAQQAGKATGAQDQADVLLAPSFNRKQHGNERTEPGLHAREKEVKPVQTTQTGVGRRYVERAGWCGNGHGKE